MAILANEKDYLEQRIIDLEDSLARLHLTGDLLNRIEDTLRPMKGLVLMMLNAYDEGASLDIHITGFLEEDAVKVIHVIAEVVNLPVPAIDRTLTAFPAVRYTSSFDLFPIGTDDKNYSLNVSVHNYNTPDCKIEEYEITIKQYRLNCGETEDAIPDKAA